MTKDFSRAYDLNLGANATIVKAIVKSFIFPVQRSLLITSASEIFFVLKSAKED